jgi:type IX secretion system PorP/SprF family membrane protein
MKQLKKILCIALFALGCVALKGQQSQTYTQYLFNRFLLNPAAAGSDGFSSVGLIIKDQWSGLTGAPSNQSFIAQVRLPEEGLFGTRKVVKRGASGFSPEKVGMGISLFNDIRGPIRSTGGQLTYAYHLEDRNGQLSFGLSVNMFQLYLDRNKMTTADEDIFLNASHLSTFVPDAAFGLHYTTPNYYVGASVSNIFQSFLMLGGNNSSSYRIERQYNLLGGYIFELNREWSLVPTMLFKAARGVMQLDATLMLYYYDQFWGSLAYRTGGGGVPGSACLSFGARYKKYYFGYAFDYSLSNIQRYSYGSHELIVTITFGQTERFFRYKRRYEYQNTAPIKGR